MSLTVGHLGRSLDQATKLARLQLLPDGNVYDGKYTIKISITDDYDDFGIYTARVQFPLDRCWENADVVYGHTGHWAPGTGHTVPYGFVPNLRLTDPDATASHTINDQEITFKMSTPALQIVDFISNPGIKIIIGKTWADYGIQRPPSAYQLYLKGKSRTEIQAWSGLTELERRPYELQSISMRSAANAQLDAAFQLHGLKRRRLECLVCCKSMSSLICCTAICKDCFPKSYENTRELFINCLTCKETLDISLVNEYVRITDWYQKTVAANWQYQALLADKPMLELAKDHVDDYKASLKWLEEEYPIRRAAMLEEVRSALSSLYAANLKIFPHAVFLSDELKATLNDSFVALVTSVRAARNKAVFRPPPSATIVSLPRPPEPDAVHCPNCDVANSKNRRVRPDGVHVVQALCFLLRHGPSCSPGCLCAQPAPGHVQRR